MIKFGVPLEYEKKAELSEKHEDNSDEYKILVKKAVAPAAKTVKEEKSGGPVCKGLNSREQ
jgi:hypothetical protein